MSRAIKAILTGRKSCVYQALYRKWRPQTFDEVIGQKHITETLKNQIKTGRLSHAYLFIGTRGTGKTTCARILAKAVNCESPVNGNPCGRCAACRAISAGTVLDIVELDAASNNGVDNVRALREEAVFSPATVKKRVYIIDEVHMLSSSAFNALLKTLEEPPAHCIFVLATTELHKLPSTIISRCQRFDFRRISIDNISRRLKYIADHEDISIDDTAAFMIARYAAGGMRDAISLFELCASTSRSVTPEIVESIIGSSGRESTEEIVKAIAGKNYEALFDAVHNTVMSSKELNVLWQELMDYYRDMVVCKYAPDPAKYLDLTEVQMETLTKNASLFSKADILHQSSLLEDAYFEMLRSPSSKRSVAELCLIRLCDPALDTSNEALLKRIEALENKISEMSYAPMQAPVQVQPEERVEQEKQDKPAARPEAVATPERAPVQAPAKEPARQVRFKQTAELIERLQKDGELMLASFIEQCKIVRDGDDKFVFVADNNFVIMQIEISKQVLAKNLSPIVGKAISEKSISATLGGTDDKHDPFDDM